MIAGSASTIWWWWPNGSAPGRRPVLFFPPAGADQTIAGLQDSMLPVEVGDTELRAGLSQAREALAAIPLGARDIVRTVGR